MEKLLVLSRKFRLRPLLLWILVPVPAILIGLQQVRPVMGGIRTVDITAAVPEAGGFQPDSIQVEAGEQVLLRFRSQDVAHGVAIGPGLGVDLGDVEPGQTKSVLLTFAEAGTFTFYCNRYCSPNHWRMRGVIAINDRQATQPIAERDPVIEALLAEGVDIDAVHSPGHSATDGHEDSTADADAHSAVDDRAASAAGAGAHGAMDMGADTHGAMDMGVGADSAMDMSAGTHDAVDTAHSTDHVDPVEAPDEHRQLRPSAARGAAFASELTIPAEIQDSAWRRRHTPHEGTALLAGANPGVAEDHLADLIAYLWTRDIPPLQLAAAQNLFVKNCAACHGEQGRGDGPAAALVAQPPVSFADAAHMLDMRSDVLYAKIRRGGMGTGMPNFGTVFTPEETWSLVDSLWKFSFEDPDAGEPEQPVEPLPAASAPNAVD